MKTKTIETDLIKQSLDAGEDFTIYDPSEKTLRYVRCWANRLGYFVTKRDGNAIVTRTPHLDKIRPELYRLLKAGEKFTIDYKDDRYIRTQVSAWARKNKQKWKVSRVEGFKYLIYPDPVAELL